MGIISVYEDLFLFIIICGGLFLLWESLLIYDHLWESFLFTRISSYLWSSVRIFPFYENLFKSLLNYDNLWESLLFMRIFLNFFLFMIICENLFLFMINYFITYFLSHLPICAYLFSSSFIIQNLFSFACIHLDQYELKIFMNINN